MGIATTVSLARVSLSNLSAVDGSRLLTIGRLVIRFIALPWIVTLAVIAMLPLQGLAYQDMLLGVSLLLAAPTAVTAVVLSRTSGGMILPAMRVALLSTAMSLANIILLLGFFGQSDLTLQAFMLVIVSSAGLLIPALIVHVCRQRLPIFVAKAAEDHADVAVLALAVFVLSFQQISLDSFYPNALIAVGLGITLRMVALRLARHKSLYGIDDYFSYSYPNIFLATILAGLLDNVTILEVTTWFPVPMFGLAPLDDLLIKRLYRSQSESKLMSYLRVGNDPFELPQAARQECEVEPRERRSGDG